jgi:hypothetical protein
VLNMVVYILATSVLRAALLPVWDIKDGRPRKQTTVSDVSQSYFRPQCG